MSIIQDQSLTKVVAPTKVVVAPTKDITATKELNIKEIQLLEELNTKLTKKLQEPIQQEQKLNNSITDFIEKKIGEIIEKKVQPNQIIEVKDDIKEAMDVIGQLTQNNYFAKLGSSNIFLLLATAVYVYGSYYFYNNIDLSTNYIYGFVSCVYFVIQIFGNIINNMYIYCKKTEKEEMKMKLNMTYVKTSMRLNLLLLIGVFPLIILGIYLYISYTMTALCIYIGVMFSGGIIYIFWKI